MYFWAVSAHRYTTGAPVHQKKKGTRFPISFQRIEKLKTLTLHVSIIHFIYTVM